MHNFMKMFIAKTVIYILNLLGFYLIICPWGIGDTLFVCMCTEALKLEKNKKIAVICKKYTGEVCKNFETIDLTIANNKLCNCFIYYGEEKGNKYKKNYVYAHILEENMSEYSNVINRYKVGILKLDKEIKYVYPSIRLKKRFNIDFFNSIIIAPYAKSKSCTPSKDFWNSIIEECLSNNLKVFTNCGSDYERELPGTIRLQVSLNDLYSIAEQTKCFIAYRSGICDWLALSKANMIVINDPMWGKEWNLNNFSLKSVKYFQYTEKNEKVVSDGIKREIRALCKNTVI